MLLHWSSPDAPVRWSSIAPTAITPRAAAGEGTNGWRPSLPIEATTVMPSGARIRGGRYSGRWRLAPVRDAWQGHAMIGSGPTASFTLSYVGGSLALIGDVWPQGGTGRIVIDGQARTISAHSAIPHARRVLFRIARRAGRHRLTIRVLSGMLPVEGLAISNRRR